LPCIRKMEKQLQSAAFPSGRIFLWNIWNRFWLHCGRHIWFVVSRVLRAAMWSPVRQTRFRFRKSLTLWILPFWVMRIPAEQKTPLSWKQPLGSDDCLSAAVLQQHYVTEYDGSLSEFYSAGRGIYVLHLRQYRTSFVQCCPKGKRIPESDGTRSDFWWTVWFLHEKSCIFCFEHRLKMSNLNKLKKSNKSYKTYWLTSEKVI